MEKRICPKCGYINSIDSSCCDECGYDNLKNNGIQKNVPKDENRPYFNWKIDEYSETAPFVQEEKAIEEIVEETPAIQVDDDCVQVKICPECGYINSIDSSCCDECGKHLADVKATTIKKEELNEKENVNEQEEPKIIKETQYFINVGVNGDNIIPLNFVNDRFIIGRKHQACLGNKGIVSRNHCYIKRTSENEFYLFESLASPSTNGTYVELNGGRLIPIEPGKGYPLINGSKFYLAKEVPVLFFAEVINKD